MKYILSIIIIVLVFSSCTTTANMLTIDTRQPAGVSFPAEVVNVVIVDNCPNTATDTIVAPNEYLMTTDSAKTVLLKSLHQFMTDENYFGKVDLLPHTVNRSSEDSVIPLSKKKIQELCSEKEADALISLDFFTISATIEKEKTGYFGQYRIIGSSIAAILNVYSKNGENYSKPIILLDSIFKSEDVHWPPTKDYRKVNGLVRELAVVGADKLTATLIPSWKEEIRWYYSDNSSEMKEASKYVKEGKWLEAADIWGTLYDKAEKPKVKARLASNIAVANEYLDDVDNAMNWLNIAMELLPEGKKSDLTTQITAYYLMLQKRENLMPRLKRQLGIEDSIE
ncbi:MAG: DUF6340 family protein [Dysgonomonas sp.]|nr:DUF6340 family protein [Dysgonomonas sp.]